MKLERIFRLSAVLMIVALGIVSCTKVTDEVPGKTDAKEIIVPLVCGGEVTNLGNTPLSRAMGDDLLYIQAYAIEDDGYAMNYAHGLFDNLEGIKIALKEGHDYLFKATLVKDGKNRIFEEESGIWGVPFNMDLTNQFVFDGYFDSYDIDRGDAELIDRYYTLPAIDRFYGYCHYTADPLNVTPININLLRTVFGVKIVTENFTDGNLIVELNGEPAFDIPAPQTEVSKVFSLNDLDEAYRIDTNNGLGIINEYLESVIVRVARINPAGDVIPVDEQYINFTRNMMTTLKVRIHSDMYENGVSITTETTDMIDVPGEVEFVGGGDF